MTTAQDRLNQILPSWYDLLTQWSLDGSLVAAATDALMLESSNAKQDAKGQLQSYVSQWSAGNFQNLPKIVLLSAADISGAYGAYADSTDTIYLNQDWLLGANAEDIQRVLTEELGHYLDDQLNGGDTQGDEGALFVETMIGTNLAEAERAKQNKEDDKVSILSESGWVAAEASSSLQADGLISVGTDYADKITDIKSLPNGSFIISGTSDKVLQLGSADFTDTLSNGGFIAKVAAEGGLEWIAAVTNCDIEGFDTLVDGSGYIATGRYYGETAQFGDTTLTNNVNGGNIFVAKLLNDGSWEWAQSIGGSGSFNRGTSAKSLIDGSVLVGGSFEKEATFGNQTVYGGFKRNGDPGFQSSYLAKLNPDGTFEWALAAPSSSSSLFDIDSFPDQSGAAVVTGYYASGNIDFGATEFTTILATGYSSLPNGYVAKSRADGSWEWARDFSGIGSTYLYSVDATVESDSATSIYSAGYLRGDVTFDGINGKLYNVSTQTLNAVGSFIDTVDGFVVKLNGNGQALWSATIAGEGSATIQCVKGLDDGSSIVTGGFQGETLFGNIELKNTTTTNYLGQTLGDVYEDIFVAKLDPAGRWVWAVNAGGTGGDSGLDIAILNQDIFAITGEFQGDESTSVFGPARFGDSEYSSIKNPNGAASSDGFTALIDTSGNWILNNFADNGDAVFSITGTPAIGNLLTASNTAADPDGNGTFSYSWQTSTNGTTWTPVGTASTYSVAGGDEGKQLQLVVSYTDLQGFGEVITTSGGTIPFVDNGNAVFSITGTPAVGNLLTATTTTADPDGNGTFSYAWQTFASGIWTTVGTNSTYTVAAADEGKQLQLVVSYTDQQGFAESITTSGGTIPFVDNGNAVFSITGTPAVGNLLTATTTTADPDGNGTFSYAWQTFASGIWTTIGTNSTYTVAAADEGKQLQLVVSYTDQQGFAESITTSGGLVPASTPQPTIGNDNLTASSSGGLISGVPSTDSTFGRGTKDKLSGSSGVDTFVLGSTQGVFYNDGVTTNAGLSDYGFIAGFSAGVDKIQLAGLASQYLLNTATIADPVTGVSVSGVGIYRNDGTGSGSKSTAWDGKDELIGFVAGATTTSLGSLSGSSFVYASTSSTPVAGGTPVTGSNNSDGTSLLPISGTSSNETFSLIGTATNYGSGQLDYAKGNGGNDLFVLGDSRGVFYKDSSTATAGTADLLWVKDFNAGDQVQLKGSASNYRLQTTYNIGGALGTGIFLNDGSGTGSSKSAWDSKDELIGFLEGVSVASLTNTAQFIYVA